VCVCVCVCVSSSCVFLSAVLADPATCLQTPYAADTVKFLNVDAVDVQLPGSVMNTIAFQNQYYDMPRKPGDRIESPTTLGRKCWAFAYYLFYFDAAEFEATLHTAGLDVAPYVVQHEAANAHTYTLCEKVCGLRMCAGAVTGMCVLYLPCKNGPHEYCARG
jgi:hypothetical protein